jgi:O-antigen/teichoic acid export membrane protein
VKLNVSSSRYGRILKAVCSGTAARVLSSGLTLISLPLAVRYLGAERYGVWATITTTAAYALDDKLSAARYFTNALLLTGGVGGVVAPVFAGVCPGINWVRLFNVSSNVSAAEVAHTVAAACVLMLLALPCNLAGKLLAGYQEQHRYNYATCTGAVASLSGLALGVALRVSMAMLFVMSAGCLTFTALINLILVVGWQKPWLLPRASLIDRSALKELLDSGSSFFLIQVAAVVVFSSDNLVVSHYLGASEVTPYSVTWRVVGLAAVLQSLVFPALWPAYAEAYAKRDYGWIRRTFRMTMKGTVALNGLCVAILLLFGRSLIRIWAGPAAVPTLALLIAMGVWAIVNGFMSVESCLLAALNRTREQALLSITAAAVNIGLSVILVRHIGSLGVIGGTILSYLVVLVVPQSLIVRSVWKRGLAVEKSSLFAIRSSLFAKATIER